MAEHAVELPTADAPGRPFDPPADSAALRAEASLTPLAFPDGHRGWLATGYTTVRRILADPRYSSRTELMHSLQPGYAGVTIPPAQPGEFLGMDAPEHTRYRKLLAGKFTARRMRQLSERIEHVTADHLDAMARHGGPLDLVSAFAQPIPATVICEILGVPLAERGRFQADAAKVFGVDTTLEGKAAAFESLSTTVRELISDKRANPTDDVLSDLTSEATDDEVAAMGGLLLAAGLDTTAGMLSLGTFALLTHSDHWAVLRTEPQLVDSAIEELMRYLSVAPQLARVALEDIDLDGQLVAAGSTVVLAVAAANRDPARFDHPDTLDLRRNPIGHLGFGHGPHLCLGAQLARLEMRIALPALATRFPDLRLAVPAAEVPLREGADIRGVTELLVTW